MAKGIASGFPLSPPSARDATLDDKWPTGSHGGTYGGNPMGLRGGAARRSRSCRSQPSSKTSSARGAQLTAGLKELQREHDVIAQVRGPGLMVGPSSTTLPASPRLQKHCLDEGRMILTERRHLREVPAVDAAAGSQTSARSISV